MQKELFLDFDINLSTFIDDLTSIIEQNNKKTDELLCIKEKTFANFIKPFEMMDEKLDQFFTLLSHINSVKNSKETQEVYSRSLPIITEYSTKLSQNLNIYKAMKEISKNEAGLNDEQKRVLELNIQNFELNGAHLDEKIKEKLQKIHLEINDLSNKFSQNLLDATNEFEHIVDEKDVQGVPASDIEELKFDDNGVTRYRLNLQMPTYIAYMTYGKNQALREILYKAYTTRAPQNAQIIDKLLELKQKMAKLLGFDNYSQYSIASKMAPSTDKVIEFIEKLIDSSIEQAKNELLELKEITYEEIKSYDTAYYSEILKHKKYDIDEELYRPYFEQNSVVKGLFEFLQRLFGLTCEQVDLKLWDEKAKAYDIYLDDKITARIYMDLEARKNKKGGAWMHNWQTHCMDENNVEQPASAFVVCNFPPSGKETPSLLRHDDVVTLFHEMGHTIHHILSKVNENEVSGVNGVEWDAVEFPSQMLENFAYEPQILKLFAKHYKTGEVLSDEMIEKLILSKNFQSGLSMLRQLEFSLFDFKLHMKTYKGDEVQTLLDNIREKTALIKPPSYNKFQNGFSHIFAGGYAAGYYSYKWAEVLSADAFFQIVDEGIFDSKTARSYLDIILKKGGSYSMQKLFFDLMQREPDVNNLLRLNGIK
ncbi:M3 family metallopeptidase [Sulfurimonas sp. HSL-1716]|uniref:M3 family metallopeptidase n=1 Tax=Hydrocurvibacter sulfurireducens TaxID=3131937 RepID=UPI0031F8D514